jgi:glutamyl-tRNA reductase
VALVFVGTDFHDTPLAELEKLERRAHSIATRLREHSEITGVVALATCNRFEVYFESEKFHESLEIVISRLAEELSIEPAVASSQLKVLYGGALAQHLFAVASGLESMIVGESEISGQVRRALTEAQLAGAASTEIQGLFQNALAVSKRVASQTGLGASGRSVISVALEIAGQKTQGLSGGRALLIGTGAYARVVVAALRRSGVQHISVFSNSGRAEAFAKSHDLTPLSKENLATQLATADVVVSASGQSGYSLDRHLIEAAAEARAPQPLVIIDVALSRDVDPELAEVPNIELFDLDALRKLAPSEHLEELVTAQEIVRDAVSDFEVEVKKRSVDPVITALRAHVGLWVDEEVAAVRRKSGDQAAREVERSLQRVTNAILHAPSVKAKDLAKDGKHEDYVRAIRLLFDIEVGRGVEEGVGEGAQA